MDLAPIVLFVYNRPWHTQQTVEALQKNELAEESELFVFSDGPKSEDDKKDVQAVRAYLKTITGFKSITVIEREHNLGLAQSIITGVTEIVNKYGRIIVLEDDLIFSPYFLDYMNNALEIYKDIEQVMHISGYMYPLQKQLPETFFYRQGTCWGWATWKRAWNYFEPDANKLLSNFLNKKQLWEFDICGSYPYFKMLQNQAKNNIDSWSIRWDASIFLQNGLCLHPYPSLVNNIGNDGTGVHCGRTSIFDVEFSKQKIKYYEKNIYENLEAVQAMVAFNKRLKRNFVLRVLQRFKLETAKLLK